jgi:Arp2/3 complex, 34 kD subunit p34-Arc
VKYGAQQVLEREYGPYVVAPENGYNFSVQVDLDRLPDDNGKLVLSLSDFDFSSDDEVLLKKHETT